MTEEYLKDKDGNPIKCCFEGTCKNYATRDIGNPFLKEEHVVIPICDEHRKFLLDGYWFLPDEDDETVYRPYREIPKRFLNIQ